MATGDRADVAESVGAVLGVDAVLSERTPFDKVEAVAAERANGSTMMVGDGINDAPALAAADVGVAMGARGGTAATETADVVLTVDRLDRLGDAMTTARRAGHDRPAERSARDRALNRRDGFAALGLLPPAAGALLQEGIDAAAILNALGAGAAVDAPLPIAANDSEVARHFAAEHELLRPELDRIQAGGRSTRNGAGRAIARPSAGLPVPRPGSAAPRGRRGQRALSRARPDPRWAEPPPR